MCDWWTPKNSTMFSNFFSLPQHRRHIKDVKGSFVVRLVHFFSWIQPWNKRGNITFIVLTVAQPLEVQVWRCFSRKQKSYFSFKAYDFYGSIIGLQRLFLIWPQVQITKTTLTILVPFWARILPLEIQKVSYWVKCFLIYCKSVFRKANYLWQSIELSTIMKSNEE